MPNIRNGAYGPAIRYPRSGACPTHRVYESLVAGNTGNALTTRSKWLDLLVQPTATAMFDTVNGTATTGASGIDVTVAVDGRAAQTGSRFQPVSNSGATVTRPGLMARSATRPTASFPIAGSGVGMSGSADEVV